MSPAPSKAITSAGARTRELLILAAERLFGEHGIDGVSLRYINSAAGQRNSSAAHYHFGSKRGLIEAIYDYRMEHVNRRRLAMLTALEGSQQQADIHAIAETILLPILEELRGSEGGCDYVRFLSMAIGYPGLDLERIWSRRHGESLVRVMALLRKALPDVPATILSQRFSLLWQQAVHALAARETGRAGLATTSELGAALFISNLIDMIAGGLAAPVSPDTRRELRVQAHQRRA